MYVYACHVASLKKTKTKPGLLRIKFKVLYLYDVVLKSSMPDQDVNGLES